MRVPAAADKDNFEPMPAPLNLVQALVYDLPRHLYRRLSGTRAHKELAGFRLPMHELAAKQAFRIACECRKRYLQNETREVQTSVENRVVQLRDAKCR